MAEQGTDLGRAMVEWDAAVWCLAGLSLHATGRGHPALLAAAEAVVAALAPTGPDLTPALGNEAAATLHNASAAASGEWADWRDNSDEALLAQGLASGQAGTMFAQVFPPDAPLAQRLRAPGARMLDVGTGVGALAVGFAEAFPDLRVVGIDVFDRALALSRDVVARSSAADRITIRQQDVVEFDDPETFDVAWLPAPFLPEDALRRGLVRIVDRLAPGGWVMVGHGRFGENPLADALTRLRTVAYGGTALDDREAEQLLTDAGLVDAFSPPVPPRAPGLTFARRPE